MSRRTRRAPALAGVLVAAVWVCWPAPRSLAGADPLKNALSDQLRVVAVDSSAYPDVTATVALPESIRQDQDVSRDLSVTTGGRRLPASVQLLPSIKRTLVLLLDTDERTSAELFATEQGAAASMLLDLDPSTPVALGTSTAASIAEPTVGPRAALATIGSLRLGGTRNWARTLAGVEATSPALIVIISTGPSQPTATPSELASQTLRAESNITWVSVGNDSGPSGPLSTIRTVESHPEDLLGSLNFVAADLTSQYQVVFRATATGPDATVSLDAYGTQWTARITITGPHRTDAAAGTNSTTGPTSSGFPVALVNDAAVFVKDHQLVWDLLALLALVVLTRANLRRS